MKLKTELRTGPWSDISPKFSHGKLDVVYRFGVQVIVAQLRCQPIERLIKASVVFVNCQLEAIKAVLG